MAAPAPIDKREVILLHLMRILGKLMSVSPGDGGLMTVARDRDQLQQSNADTDEPTQLPSAVLLDGKEALATNIKGQQFTAMPPAYFTMEPQVWIVLRPRDKVSNMTLDGQPAPIGPELSAWRAKVLKAVLQDQNLILAVGAGGQIEYRGCETDMAFGATMVGQIMLQFAFTYTLNIADL